MNGAVETQDLLRWLLYWDKITYTGIGLGEASISGNNPPDVEFLEQEGKFSTEIIDLQKIDLGNIPTPTITTISFAGPQPTIWGLTGKQFAVAAAAARLELSKQLSEKSSETIWTIGQSGGERLILPGEDDKQELLDIQLIDCLPVPVEGNSFADILEFKNRYSGELDELRIALDGLRENILSASDERRATEAAIHKIGRAISDIRSALKGARIQTFNETLALYTENPSLGFWGPLGAIVAPAAGSEIEVGVAAGMATATIIKFLKRTIPGSRNLPDAHSEFTYVYEAIKELN